MASTAKRPSAIDISSYHPQQKKARLFAPERDADKPQPKIDPTYGQRGAFPGLDDVNGDDGGLFYGPAGDGLQYLRMVRLEAKGVPNLLVAPATASTLIEDRLDDPYAPYEARGEGWYSDGAYTAAPTRTAVQVEEEAADLDPQDAYYTALLARLQNMRAALAASPPSLPSADGDNLSLVTRALLSNPTFRSWKNALLKSTPTSNVLCSLSQESIIQGIGVLEYVLTLQNLKGEREKRIGAWAWGLLSRCRDVGEMDSEDVSVLRGFGKKASALLRRIRAVGDAGGVGEEGSGNDDDEIDGIGEEIDAEVARMQAGAEAIPDDALADPETGVALDVAHSLEEAQEALLSRLDPVHQAAETGTEDTDPATADAQKHVENGTTQRGDEEKEYEEQVSDAHATLDMIVTIVGESYGQRDLLDGRLAWEEL